MRRSSLALTILFAASLAAPCLARDAAPATRLDFAAELPPLAAPPAGLRADTLFLFAASGPGAWGAPGTSPRGYTFDDGAGAPAAAGWAPDDFTDQLAAYWHLQDLYLSNGHGTDFSGADDFADGGPTAGNDYAWWCGRSGPCGWAHPIGYGSYWDQWLVLETPPGGGIGTIEFDYIADFEGDVYDYFTLYKQSNSGQLTELLSNHVSGEQTLRHYGPIAFSDIEGGALVFAFHSDGGWSDEDGSYVSDIGAVWLDNVEVVYPYAPDVAWDFESGVESDFPALTASWPAGAGLYGALYRNLFSEDQCTVNSSYAWAFFDVGTTNPDYPIPVIPYGPPYVDNGIVSPVLDSAHGLGDPLGQPMDEAWGPNSQFLVRFMVYRDLPLNALIFYSLDVQALVDDLPCLGVWSDEGATWYGGDGQWEDWFVDYTLRLRNSAGGGNVVGARVKLRVVDQCGVWCNEYGDGSGHTPAPYFDTIGAMVVNSSGVAWNVDYFRRFQDSFPGPNGKVRIDSAIDVQPTNGTALVIGDSTRVDLDMSGEGGILPDYASVPGERRPSLYLHWRVAAGPHQGATGAALGDPDATDGVYSPWIGTAPVNGETWNVAVADTLRYQGTAYPGKFAFDLADDVFEPGDLIEFYYKASSVTGGPQTRPLWAESSDPALRDYYTVRCLPTAGASVLFVEDAGPIDAGGPGVSPRDRRLATYWQEAFRYCGYDWGDVYTTQAPSSGQHNGPGGRALLGALDQYALILWDSGDLPSYTIQNALPDDLAFDDALLHDWLIGGAHDTFLWVMGDEVASDLMDEPSFLGQDLGAQRILGGTYYDDLTGIRVPRVLATHPALAGGGAQPYFDLDAGCPQPENLDLVRLNAASPLAVEAFAYAVTAGAPIKAGIFNQDPDGNGLVTSPTGHRNWTLFNPFSYGLVLDAGYGLASGLDYARGVVGAVLAGLFQHLPQGDPDGVDVVPARTALAGAYPNPFNPSTAIRFALAQSERVRLEVFDLAGRRVRILVDGPLPAAQHEIIWDGANAAGRWLPSGVYFARLVAGDYGASERLVLLK